MIRRLSSVFPALNRVGELNARQSNTDAFMWRLALSLMPAVAAPFLGAPLNHADSRLTNYAALVFLFSHHKILGLGQNPFPTAGGMFVQMENTGLYLIIRCRTQ